MSSLNFSQSVRSRLQSMDNYIKSSLKDSLVKLVSDQRLRVIKEIKCSLTPLSTFPNISLAKTFSEYFQNRHSLHTTTDEQPLVETDFLNLNQNFILRSNSYKEAKKQKLTEYIYIAEHLHFLPFSESQAFPLFMLPSIFYRANHLLKIRKLKHIIENECINKLMIEKVYILLTQLIFHDLNTFLN